MRPCHRLFAGLTLALACSLGHAAHWVCNLSEELVELVCVADADPVPVATADAPPAPRALVRGVSFPLDEQLEYRVPLWTPPSDAEFVLQLAQATMCYRSPGCSVMLAPASWALLSRPRIVAAGPRRR
ncbi:MAG: hypothetical protein U1F56_10190 [Rubrivivax sp.]